MVVFSYTFLTLCGSVLTIAHGLHAVSSSSLHLHIAVMLRPQILHIHVPTISGEKSNSSKSAVPDL